MRSGKGQVEAGRWRPGRVPSRRYARTVFRQVPDADYIYCDGSGLVLSTDYVRWCQRVWEVALTATTWGEFADRLTAVDPELATYLFGEPLDEFLGPGGSGRERADPFDAALDDDYDFILSGFPFGGGDDQYGWWWSDLPEEVVDLLGGDEYAYFYDATLKAALELIASRGEVAVEDCALIDELAYPVGLLRRMREQPPP